MSLPKEFHTPRYESLPKGLKARADAIINKKFGLKTDVKKVSTSVQEAANKFKQMAELMAMDTSGAWDVGAMTQLRVEPQPRIEQVEYRANHHMFEVIARCMNCGSRWTNMVSESHSMQMYEIRFMFSCNCGKTELRVDAGELESAYRKFKDRQRFNPIYF